MQNNNFAVFSDGACKGNPGIGGWGAIIRHNGVDIEIFGGEDNTTNNRMEMMAAIRALESIMAPGKIIVVTDSRYLVDGATKWIFGWVKKGWVTSGKDPVKNKDLWERLLKQMTKHEVTWKWIKGHNGYEENEKADELANKGIYSSKG